MDRTTHWTIENAQCTVDTVYADIFWSNRLFPKIVVRKIEETLYLLYTYCKMFEHFDELSISTRSRIY